ncbi:MAG: peptidyl-prolyl cis-trans isomerase [Burkholderiales bacterium]|nr:peptidyl-prolyl cis-trans isomerase [Burkholderiales bacterium]
MNAAINGVRVEAEAEALVERAWGELLRQEAVRRGLLPQVPVQAAPELRDAEQQAIHAMLDEAVPTARPGESECRRYYEAHKARYVEGRRVQLRHILFAVTGGVDVNALAARAEQALAELKRPPARFAELARELSNCPSGADGGELGWLAPEECAPELSKALFADDKAGLLPRLVHSRHGFHVIEVLARENGRQLAFEEVRGRIALELAQGSRATALHQYIRVLAGQAKVEGIDLEAAQSPLVQ